MVVTDLIVAELHLHLLHGFGPQRAAQHVNVLVSDPWVEEIFVDRDLQTRAMDEWIRRFEDQEFTLTDAVSFAVMNTSGITTAFTFDAHLNIAGFHMVPAGE